MAPNTANIKKDLDTGKKGKNITSNQHYFGALEEINTSLK